MSFLRAWAPERIRWAMVPSAGFPLDSQGMKVNARITRPIVRAGSATRQAGFLILSR